MNENVSAAAVGGRISHMQVVLLALLASVIIMLIGITVRATDDMDGYGVSTSPSAIYRGNAT